MCFSPFASFTLAGFLSITGLLSSYYSRKNSSLFFLSIIPFIFALQQWCEGVVWVYGPNSDVGYWTGFLFFYIALAWWPFWMPLSVYRAEPNIRIKKLILPYLIAGLVWLMVATCAILMYPLSIQINNNIIYSLAVPFDISLFAIGVYLLLVAGPLLLTTIPYARIFALSIVSAFGISYWLWYHAFGSVWCFFAAWLSVLIVFMIRKNS
ncbi:MAG: DUF6629 family protein [Candidatus Dependentiae bacterium]